jgi:hypothetical protein
MHTNARRRARFFTSIGQTELDVTGDRRREWQESSTFAGSCALRDCGYSLRHVHIPRRAVRSLRLLRLADEYV